jgi:hypothetical protein
MENTSYDFDHAYRRMVARRTGQERSYLQVQFLRRGRVEREGVLEAKYAPRAMGNWTARGPEYRVRNEPVQLPRYGGMAMLMRNRAFRSQARRLLVTAGARSGSSYGHSRPN